MVKVIKGIFKGRICKTLGNPNSDGYVRSFLVNVDGTVDQEYFYLNIKNIEKEK